MTAASGIGSPRSRRGFRGEAGEDFIRRHPDDFSISPLRHRQASLNVLADGLQERSAEGRLDGGAIGKEFSDRGTSFFAHGIPRCI